MAARTRSTSTLLLLVAAALLLRWCVSSTGFVGGAAPAGLRGSTPAMVGAVTRAAASADTVGKVADVIAEQLGVDKEK
eukprot:CAMPEP_0115631792 /NCGR_PEP_ID=MMETSP0272-20121206/31182_1 /TAXON_ID=71861 /ORGANISM="Scrippsiella trochoidea, Strain CCMP3099" /LENGTH=77 /DNA_ID=CAMNT_0003068469 /DNA_START=75 /DNA_END=305 /DNA_ORIENTATION=+